MGAATGRRLLHQMLLGLDEVVQPLDVVLRGGKLMVHQRQRVAVDSFLEPLDGFPETRPPALQESPATLQQTDPGLGLQVLEEREPHGEAAVLGGLLAGSLQELGEQGLALLGDPVDVLSPTHLLPGEDHLDGGLALEALQGGVQRAVAHLPEAAQGVRQALLELVAVHGPLFEQSQDGQLQHARCAPIVSIYRPNLSSGYIETIYAASASVNPACPASRGTSYRLRGAE